MTIRQLIAELELYKATIDLDSEIEVHIGAYGAWEGRIKDVWSDFGSNFLNLNVRLKPQSNNPPGEPGSEVDYTSRKD